MKLQHLRALVAIVDEGSFSEAALCLGTSQSTVSNAIAELEEELGVRLLDRGRFGATPTEVGSRVVAHARRLEGVVSAIVQEALLEKGDLRGTLRVSAFRSAATHVLPAVIDALRERHPGLRVEVHEVNSRCVSVSPELEAGKVDVALTMSILADGTVFWEILRDRYVAVVPSGFDHSDGPVSIERMLDHPLILSDGPCSFPIRDRVLALDPAFRPSFEISEDSTIIALVAQGLGAALMPELTTGVLPPGVRQLDLSESIERRVGVALATSSLKIPSVRAFLAVVRELYPTGDVPSLGEPLPSANRSQKQNRSSRNTFSPVRTSTG
jgi:DNA-binding transcriptional LysR family regulator